MTGYPSIDRPWLKYYSGEAISKEVENRTLYESLVDRNKDYQRQCALQYFGKETTYDQLFTCVDETANAFARIGVKQNDVVSLCTVTIPETIYSFYAINKLGAVSNMIDPRTSPDGIKHYLIETRSKVLVVLDIAYPKIEEIIEQTKVSHVIIISAADSMPALLKLGYRISCLHKPKIKQYSDRTTSWLEFLLNGRNARADFPGYRNDAPAVIVHTGGTTGTPKGVLFSDKSYENLLTQLQHAGIAPERNQRFLNIMPPFIAYGLLCGIHIPLCSGARLILIPKFDPQKFDRIIKKYRPNHFWGVPTHFDNLLNSKRLRHRDLSFIICAGVGGDGLNKNSELQINRFLEEHNCSRKVIKGYGMTELNSAACVCSCDINEVGSVGIPLVQTLISAFTPGTQTELRYSEIGEICISSPATMLRYSDNDEETNRVLQKHQDGRTWVHSGDLGYVTEEGLVYIVDRIKRMIIRTDGFKVYPSVIENTILMHDSVGACAVIGVKAEQSSQGMAPIAAIVVKQNEQNNKERILGEIALICKQALAEYMLPEEYIVMDQLPLTPIGKTDFSAVEDYVSELKRAKIGTN